MKLLKEYINERRDKMTNQLSRRSRKKLRKRLMKARMGRWSGTGDSRKFVPLTKKEQEELILMIRHGNTEYIEDHDEILIDEEQFAVENQKAGKRHKWYNNWHTPFVKRPGLLNDWWGKGVKIKFRAAPYAKMVHWCQAAHTECSGLGKIKEHKDENGKVVMVEVVDIMLFEQECTAGYTELSQEALQKFLFELAKRNESPGQWKLWWHTHYNFGVFWSGVDDANVSRLINLFGGYLVSTVINQNCDIKGRIDQVNAENKEDSADCDVTVVPIRNNKLKNKCIRQVQKLVKERVYTYTPPANNSYYGKNSYYSPGGKFTGFTQREAERLHSVKSDKPIPSLGYALGNVMGNLERRRQGIPQDPDLADYLPNFEEVANRGVSGVHSEPIPFFIE